jgi:type II secretory pathway pseudopilin PulG
MPNVLRLGRQEGGFMMVELLMAITVTVIALTALVAVFSQGVVGMRSSTSQTSAVLLADAQMETYRTMVYRDIGLDMSAATVAALDSTYTGDSACANAATGDTCGTNGADGTETEPTGVLPNSCTTINGWYSNTNPCTPSRTITSGSSPDSHPYRIDTYVTLAPAVTTGSSQMDQYKQVTVVVRDGNKVSTVLARESSTFVCANGQVPGDTADC